MSGNGIIRPGAIQPQPSLQVATPINDIQLVALVGAVVYASDPNVTTAAEAVGTAIELVTESIAQCGVGNRHLIAKMQEKIKQREDQR